LVVRWVAVLVALVFGGACGRLAFDERAPTDTAVQPCSSWGPFSTPQHIVELGSGGDDWAPRVTADALELYLYSSRAGSLGSFDIYVAHRDSSTLPWQVPTDVTELNSAATERTSFVSEDGLTFLLTTDRTTANSSDIWMATRASRTAPFSAPAVIAEIMSSASDGSPWLSPDGLRLYFSSDRLGMENIFVATRANTGTAFGPPAQITELISTGNEREIALSHDELEAFVVIDTGNFDIYRTTRPDLGSPFSALQRVTELSTARDEIGVSLTADGTTMFLNYDAVASGAGNSEIFQATRSCLQ